MFSRFIKNNNLPSSFNNAHVANTSPQKNYNGRKHSVTRFRGPRLEFNSNKPDIYWTFFSISKEFIQFLDPTFIGSRFLIPAKEEYLLKNTKLSVNECQKVIPTAAYI